MDTMTVPAYAVIPSRGRINDLADTVAAIAPQVELVIIVDNGYEPPLIAVQFPGAICMHRYTEDPPNISRLWNLGIACAGLRARHAGYQEWDVAVLNDDAVVCQGWLTGLSEPMRGHNAALACADPHGTLQAPLHKTEPDSNIAWRLTGWAYVLRGEYGLTLDEQFGWWWGDTDLDWRARQTGGLVIVPGLPVEHRWPNAYTNDRPELAAQTALDRAAFQAKWGRVPW